MPESWYLMSQPLFNSGFEGDEFSAFAQGGFEEILDSPLADEIEIYEKTLSATPVSARAIIQGVTADNYNNSVLRQFLCKDWDTSERTVYQGKRPNVACLFAP